jgi:hypothetical protein
MPHHPRRRFTAEYKLGILQEIDACKGPGEVGELLLREDLYSSHIAAWRRARAQAELIALAPKKRGPKPRSKEPKPPGTVARDREIARLTAENRQLRELCEVQAKRIVLLLNELRAALLEAEG